MDASTDITVRVNGRERRIPRGLNVEGLLRSLGLHPALVVVERNREIVPRGEYAATPVEEGDVLELVHFVGGG